MAAGEFAGDSIAFYGGKAVGKLGGVVGKRLFKSRRGRKILWKHRKVIVKGMRKDLLKKGAKRYPFAFKRFVDPPPAFNLSKYVK